MWRKEVKEREWRVRWENRWKSWWGKLCRWENRNSVWSRIIRISRKRASSMKDSVWCYNKEPKLTTTPIMLICLIKQTPRVAMISWIDQQMITSLSKISYSWITIQSPQKNQHIIVMKIIRDFPLICYIVMRISPHSAIISQLTKTYKNL